MALSIVGTITLSYIKFFISKDYFIYAEVPCDPNSESCFYYVEHSDCADGVNSECVFDNRYVKYIYKLASDIHNTCDDDSLKNDCNLLVCTEQDNPNQCYYELCETDNCEL